MNHFDQQEWDDADEKWVQDMKIMFAQGFACGVFITIIMLLVAVFAYA